jgi:hypothetical protein
VILVGRAPSLGVRRTLGNVRHHRASSAVNVFISYRRTDTAAVTGRIFDRLAAHFGADSVFMDIDNVPLGVDFRQYIRDKVTTCDICLAIIGREWLHHRVKGLRRIDDPSDFVRLELESALNAGITVVPVLIGQTEMPKPSQFPASISNLAFRNAAQVDIGRDFHVHMDRLIAEIEHLAQCTPQADRALHTTSATRRLKGKSEPHADTRDSDSKPGDQAQPNTLARYLLFVRPRAPVGWILRVVCVWTLADTIALFVGSIREGGDRGALYAYAAAAVVSYLIALRVDAAPAVDKPPNAAARYLLWYLPRSGIEWLVRFVLVYALTDVAILLVAISRGGADRDSLQGLIAFLVIALISYSIAIVMGRSRWTGT